MSSPNISYSNTFTARLAATSGVVTAGMVVCPNAAGEYVPATLANRTAIGRIGGVAITVGAPSGFIVVQHSGEVPPDVTGLGVGAIDAVIVSDTGTLMRAGSTPAAGAYIMGDCGTDGGLTLADVSRIWPAGGGSSTAVPFITVATVAALGSQSITGLTSGTPAYVTSIRSEWKLDLTSALSVDGISIIAANGGTGRWVRSEEAHPYWRTLGTLFVDYDGGDDEDTGTSAPSAVETSGEIQRRWGLGGRLQQATTITIAGTPTDDLPLNVNTGIYRLTINSTPTVTATQNGTGVTVTALDRDANTRMTLADTSLPAANSWTAHVDARRLVRWTNGPAAGAVCWLSADLGTKTARLYEAGLTVGDTISSVTPTNDDAYTIETLPQATLGYTGKLQGDGVTIKGFHFIDDAITLSPGASMFFVNCIFAPGTMSVNAIKGSVSFLNCLFLSEVFIQGGVVEMQGGGGRELITIRAGSSFTGDNNMILDSGPGALSLDGGVVPTLGGFGVFNATVVANVNPNGDGIFMGHSGSRFSGGANSGISNRDSESADVTHKLFGSGNAGYGLAMYQGGHNVAIALNVPSITGTDGDYTLGHDVVGPIGTNISSVSDGDGITYIYPRTNTWALFDGTNTEGGTGAAYNVHNLTTNNHMYLGYTP